MRSSSGDKYLNLDSKLFGVGLVLVLLAAVALRVGLLSVPFERDEGEYAYMGQLMLDGIPPYGSAYSLKLPGIHMAYAVIMGVFGQSVVAVHLGLLIINLATILVLHRIGAKLFNRATGLAAGAFFAVISVGQEVQGIFANAEHFVILPAMGGLLLLIDSAKATGRWRVFASGLLFGAAVLVKQHGAFFAAFGGLFLFHCECRRDPFDKNDAAARLTLFTAGVIAPFGLTSLLLLWSGVFGAFWFWTVTYAQVYIGHFTLAEGMDVGLMQVNAISGSAWAIWLLAGLGATAMFSSRALRRYAPFLGGLAVASVLAVVPGFYFRSHYFVLMLPAVALLAAVGVASAGRFFSRLGPATSQTTIPLLLSLLACASSIYQQRDFLFQMTGVEASAATYGTYPFPESIELARYIEERTSPEDRIVVFGSEPQIYFYTHLRAATRFLYLGEIFRSPQYASEMLAQMRTEVTNLNPKFLVFSSRFDPQDPRWRDGSSAAFFAWMTEYAERHYERVGVIEISRVRPSLYRWGEAARTPPASRHWLMVYQRREPDGNQGISVDRQAGNPIAKGAPAVVATG
jgi:hypothetical protein